jgi:(1->4)-alpha-D-glucan 1-alpha-D-glucosylmutase
METWDFSLVDPDNRRAVDYAARIAMWEELRRKETQNRRGLVKEMVSTWKDGRIKLYLTDKALDFRRAHAEVFLDGDYLPLEVGGSKKDNVIAFCRRRGDVWAMAVAPRWSTHLTSPATPPLGERIWGDTAVCLPEGAPVSWQDGLTGVTAGAGPGILFVRDVLRHFPVALLINRGQNSS